MKRRPKLEVFPIDRSPGRKLYQAHTRMRQGLTRLFEEAGYPLTTEGWALLNQLWEEEPLAQRLLWQKLEKDGPAVSRLVDALEAKGYVKRRTSRVDRRSREVALTAKGRAAREPLNRLATEFLDHAFVGVSPSEMQVFVDVLNRLIERLDAAPTPPAPSQQPAPLVARARKREHHDSK